jgi:hypothetical protein
MIWILLMLVRMQILRLFLKTSIRPDLSMNFAWIRVILHVSVLLRYLHTIVHTVKGLIRSIRWHTVNQPATLKIIWAIPVAFTLISSASEAISASESI